MNKIKEFFRKIFGKKTKRLNEASVTKESIVNQEVTQEDFINNLKSKYQESDEKLKLFEMFRHKKIKEEELTEEQKKQIEEIYDKKILEEKKKIEFLNKKILKYQSDMK